MENIALQIWQILYSFVLGAENNTQFIPLGTQGIIALQSWQIFCSFILSMKNEYPRV